MKITNQNQIIKKALVIDDDSSVRQTLKEILPDYGYEVDTFENPVCFLNIRNTNQCPEDKPCCDILIVDNEMPEMTGVDFLNRLDEMKCKIPPDHKTIYSGNIEPNDCKKVSQIGCKVFHKPHFDKLIRWIQSMDK